MNYESGLSRLQSSLARLNNQEALQSVENLRERLIRSSTPDERNATLHQLNRFAYRYAGTSFDALCVENKRFASTRFLSLRQFLYSIIVIVLLPGLGAVFAAPLNQQIADIEEQTRRIDQVIASGIAAPYYLSLLTPCSPTAQQRLVTTGVVINVSDRSDKGCIWAYTDKQSSQVIARDYWAGNGIYKREYLAGSRFLAVDNFDQGNQICFKRRTYFDNGVMFGEQCFSEAGVPSEAKFQNRLRSPIPPPFYWFFYR